MRRLLWPKGKSSRFEVLGETNPNPGPLQAAWSRPFLLPVRAVEDPPDAPLAPVHDLVLRIVEAAAEELDVDLVLELAGLDDLALAVRVGSLLGILGGLAGRAA